MKPITKNIVVEIDWYEIANAIVHSDSGEQAKFFDAFCRSIHLSMGSKWAFQCRAITEDALWNAEVKRDLVGYLEDLIEHLKD
jgi:hypothetical protein